MDSGATYLYNRYIKQETKGSPGTHIKDKRKLTFEFYETDTFLDFRDLYIEFVKENQNDMFAAVSMDVINNAEMSYKSLKYIESKGAKVLPVYHLGSDEKWLKRYVDEGYDYLCIGGITPNPYEAIKESLDRIWGDILTDSNGMPKVKVHGLACTGFRLMWAYPWYSVDSATWTKLGAWGGIYVPRTKKGVFDFTATPFGIQVSEKSSKLGVAGHHIETVGENECKHINRWLDYIGVPYGGKEEPGVSNDYEFRMRANLAFYIEFSRALPEWPWPFITKGKRKRLI